MARGRGLPGWSTRPTVGGKRVTVHRAARWDDTMAIRSARNRRGGAMTDDRYAINYQPLVGALQRLDVQRLIDNTTDAWYNQTLCRVGDVVVRLGVMQGEYHWHKHDEQDEFFFVLDGHFIIDLEGRSVDLQPREGFVVP